MRRLILSILFVLFISSGACADDFTFFGGSSTFNASNEHDLAYAVRYGHELNKYMSLSMGYINEGHVAEHKRDGLAFQGWLMTDTSKRLSVGVGAGLYVYADTIRRDIDRGVGLIITGDATYSITSRMFIRGEISRIVARDNADSDLFMLGVGFKM